MMKYFKDEITGDVYAYDNEQMAVIEQINSPDFNEDIAQIPEIFFEINEKIKGMREMTQAEVEARITTPTA